MHSIAVNKKKQVMNLKKTGEGHIGEFGRRKQKREML